MLQRRSALALTSVPLREKRSAVRNGGSGTYDGVAFGMTSLLAKAGGGTDVFGVDDGGEKQ